MTNQNLSAMKKRRAFRKSPENSYGTEEGLMAQSSPPSVPNFYLMTPLKQPEYGRVKMTDNPDEIINKYKLHEKATTSRLCRVCTAYLMRAQTVTMNWRNIWTKKVTSKALLSLPYGSTRHAQLNLYWSLTILELNTSRRTICTTWPTPSKNITTSRLIPMGKNWWKLS